MNENISSFYEQEIESSMKSLMMETMHRQWINDPLPITFSIFNDSKAAVMSYGMDGCPVEEGRETAKDDMSKEEVEK